MADNHSPSKVLYKYARKSVGASTTATGGGAANTSTKLGGAALYSTATGPVLGQGASWAQTGRPSAGAAENCGDEIVVLTLTLSRPFQSSKGKSLKSQLRFVRLETVEEERLDYSRLLRWLF